MPISFIFRYLESFFVVLYLVFFSLSGKRAQRQQLPTNWVSVSVSVMRRQNPLPHLQNDVWRKKGEWNVRQFLRSQPSLCGFWHAYEFCVTQTFHSFWGILTFFHTSLLRSDETLFCFPKLNTMEITIVGILLGTGPHMRCITRKCQALRFSHPANRNRLGNPVCTALLHLVT